MSNRPWIAHAAIAAIYFIVATRYPQWTQDDPGWFGYLFPAYDQMPLGHRLHVILFEANSGTNEFRVYGLSKLLHYGLAHLIGPNVFAFWSLSAIVNIIAAWCVSIAVSRVSQQWVIGFAAFTLWLIGPYSLWQTFHHVTYFLLPLMFVAIYAAVFIERERYGRALIALGVLLTLLTANTGEAAIGVLLVLQAVIATTEFRVGRRSNAAAQAAMALSGMAMVGALYAYYRLVVFRPAVAVRFGLPAEWNNTFGIIQGYLGNIAGLWFPAPLSGSYFDPIILLLTLAAVAVAITVIWTQTKKTRANPAAFLVAALLFAAVCVLFLLIGLKGHYSMPEYRYLQLPGLMLTIVIVMATSFAGPLRKWLLGALVVMGAVSFVATFAVKVPSNYVLNERVGEKILAVKTPQSRGILLFRNPDNMLGRGFMQFFSYDPSANPLELMWSLQSYAIFVWGFEKVGVQYSQNQDGKVVLRGQFGDSVLDPSEIVVVYRSGDALKDPPVTRPEQIEVFPSIAAFEAAHGDHGKHTP